MIQDQYRKDIQDLIRALEELLLDNEKIKNSDASISTVWFGEYTSADIIDTVFAILKGELERFEILTEKEFKELLVTDDVEALREILNKGLDKTVPDNLPEVVKILQEKPIGEKGIRKPTVLPATQTAEYRLRAQLNYLRLQQNVKILVPERGGKITISSSKADEIREEIKKDEERYKQALEAVKREIGNKLPSVPSPKRDEAASAVIGYVARSKQGQNLATVSTEKIESIARTNKSVGSENVGRVLNIEPVIEVAASAIAIPLVLQEEVSRNSLVTKARVNPSGFRQTVTEKLVRDIEAQNIGMSEEQKQNVRNEAVRVAAIYTDRLITLDTANPVGFPVINEALVKQLVDQAKSVSDEEIERVVQEVPLVGQGADKGRASVSVEEARERPEEFRGKLKVSIFGPNRILSDTEQANFDRISEQYRVKLVNLTPSETYPIIDKLRVNEAVGEIATLDEVLVTEPQAITPKSLTSGEEFGENTEIVEIAVSDYLEAKEETIPIIPDFGREDKKPEVYVLTEKVLQEKYGVQTTRTSEGRLVGSATYQTTLTPFEIRAIPLAVRISLPEAAKTDAVAATAKAFYYLHGYTKSSFEIAAKQAGLTPSQIGTFTDYLETFETAHPDFAGILAAERASLNVYQIEAIFTGPQGIYENYTVQVPQVGGLRGLGISFGQQIFGGVADRFVDRTIRQGLTKALAKTGQVVAKKLATSAIGKVLQTVGAAVGVLGGVVGKAISVVGGWLLSKAQIGIKTNIGKFLGGAGMLLGFIVGGPVGAIVGGILGAGVAGVNWKKIGKWATIIISAVLAAVFGAIALPLAITFIGVPILVVFILFIINSGAYVVPPGIPLTLNVSVGAGIPVTCTKDALPLTFSNTALSPIAQKAWSITNNMFQGFWCYWNWSKTDYPELFNESLYQQDPNPTYPGPIQGYDRGMFWCTWLIMKAYQDGGGIILAYNPGARGMQNDFKGRGKYVEADQATPENIVPGSVVFFSKYSGSVDHVGLVYSLNQDAIVFLQSNAPTKNATITFNENGVGAQPIRNSGDEVYLNVLGFGLP